jgi:AcrR family transcriptional regulator
LQVLEVLLCEPLRDSMAEMNAPTRPKSVADRLLETAKRLFAAQGVENTTTAQIARESGTSESQLMKYFQSKEGLLQAIFEAGWRKLGFVFMASSIASEPEERLRIIFELFLKALNDDPELRHLFLLEGRRIRHKSHDILLTEGYFHLIGEVEQLAAAVMAKNPNPPKIGARAVASALVGTIESMMRDQSVSIRHTGKQEPSVEEIRTMFHLMIDSLAARPRP